MDNLNCLFFKYQIESLVDMKVGHTIDEVERGIKLYYLSFIK